MKAMLVPTGGEPRTIEVEGLKDLQRAVGGRIDAAGWIFDDEPAVYVNDEGLYDCEPNRAVYATEADAGKTLVSGERVEAGALLGVIFGDFVAVGFDPSTGEDRDISDEEIARVMERFGGRESIVSGRRETMRTLLSR